MAAWFGTWGSISRLDMFLDNLKKVDLNIRLSSDNKLRDIKLGDIVFIKDSVLEVVGIHVPEEGGTYYTLKFLEYVRTENKTKRPEI